MVWARILFIWARGSSTKSLCNHFDVICWYCFPQITVWTSIKVPIGYGFKKGRQVWDIWPWMVHQTSKNSDGIVWYLFRHSPFKCELGYPSHPSRQDMSGFAKVSKMFKRGPRRLLDRSGIDQQHVNLILPKIIINPSKIGLWLSPELPQLAPESPTDHRYLSNVRQNK